MKGILAEYEPQKATCVLFPYRKDIWRENALPAQKMIVELVNHIAAYESVILGVIPKLVEFVKTSFALNKNVTIYPVEYNDSWARDSLSSVYIDGDKKRVNAFGFNAYGTPLYTPFDDDQRLNEGVYEKLLGYEVHRVPVTLEWGNVVPDGKGTIFVIEETIVNDNRNPDMTKVEIEKILLEQTGSKKVVWLPYGLECDETGGHVDNVLAFADEKTMLLSYTDDVNNVHYKRTHALYDILQSCTNADGEKYKIVKIPVPDICIRNAADSNKVRTNDGSLPRREGDNVLYTYVNFALINGAVVMPKFGLAEDEEAKRIVQETFPTRKVIALNAHEAFLGGGGFHCLTKHIN